MKKWLFVFMAMALILSSGAWAEDLAVSGRISGAVKALDTMIHSKDAPALAAAVKEGIGVAIFPDVVKAGFVISGRYGEGLMLRHDPKTGKWYGPAFFSIGGGSFGLQVGASSTALILTVNNEEGMKAFRGSTFTIGADVTAAVGPGGHSSSVGVGSNASAPLYSYSITKGIFAGVALDGSAISELPKVNDAYWGKHISNVQAFKTPADKKAIKPLIDALNKLIKQAR